MKPLSFYLSLATLVLLPAYVVRFQIGPLPSTLLEVLILATAASWVIENGFFGGISGIIERLKSPILIPGSLLIGVALVEVFFGPDLKAGLGLWRAYFLEPFLLGIVILDYVRRGFGQPLIFYLIASAVWISLITMGQMTGLFTEISDRSAASIGTGRALAVFNTPNAVPLYLGPLAILATALIWRRMPAMILVVVLSTLAVLDSKSRGGLIGLAAGWAAVLAGLLSSVNKSLTGLFWKVATALPIVLAILFAVFFINISTVIKEINQPERHLITDTGYARFCLWEGTQNILKNSPLTGAGLSGFSRDYAKNFTCSNEVSLFPHNFFLNFWTEVGLTGLAIMLFLIYRLLSILRRAPDQVLAIGLAGAFIYILVHGLVDVPYFKNDLAAEFWVLASLAVATAEGKINFFKNN